MQQNVFLGVCLSLSVFGAQAQSFEWGGRFGGIGEDVVRKFYVDAAGNSYTTGYFTDSANFAIQGSPNMLTSNGFFDVFVQKTGPDGNLLWAKPFGGASFDYGTGITADGQGNVYVTGVFEEAPDFDPGPGTAIVSSNGAQDIFLVKFDASGTFQWAKNVGGGGYDESTSVGTDADGNVYLSGYFNDTADFNPGAGVFEMIGAGMNDNFVLKLTANGDFIWAKQYGSSDFEAALAMKVRANGDQYITGFFNGTVDFDPGASEFEMEGEPFNNTGYLLKLDSAGNFQLARKFGGTGPVICYDLDLDAAGNIYIGGNFQGTADLDPGAGILEYTSTFVNGFALKLDASANFVWAKNIESVESVIPYSIDVSPTGTVMSSGYMETNTDFDPDPAGIFELGLSSNNAMGAFISLLDNNGDFIYAFEFGGCNFADYHGAYTDAANNIYISGAFETTVDINPDPAPVMLDEVVAMDFRDNYLIKLKPAHASVPTVNQPVQLSVYPNPATDNLVLQVDESLLGEMYSLYDDAGREILAGKLLAVTTSMDVSNLSQGVYILRVNDAHSLKFVKN